MSNSPEHLRMAEALLFAAEEPLDEASIAAQLPDDVDVAEAMAELTDLYATRGVNLVQIGGRWSLRTAPDLKHLLERHVTQPRRLSRAAVETLAIIAYHQPVTRAEIEDIRGVGMSRGTMDTLMEIGWVRPRGRRRTPGRPVTYGTSGDFLEHFGLEEITDLPGLEELKATGLLRPDPPAALIEEARAQAAAAANELKEGEQEDDDGAEGDEDFEESGSSVVPMKAADDR
jgi:segregation and condensation protein B